MLNDLVGICVRRWGILRSGVFAGEDPPGAAEVPEEREEAHRLGEGKRLAGRGGAAVNEEVGEDAFEDANALWKGDREAGGEDGEGNVGHKMCDGCIHA